MTRQLHRRGFFAFLSEPWFRFVSGGHRGPSRARVPSKCSIAGCPQSAAAGLGGLCSPCYVDLYLKQRPRAGMSAVPICELCPRPATYRLCRTHHKCLTATNRLCRWKGFPDLSMDAYIADLGAR